MPDFYCLQLDRLAVCSISASYLAIQRLVCLRIQAIMACKHSARLMKLSIKAQKTVWGQRIEIRGRQMARPRWAKYRRSWL